METSRTLGACALFRKLFVIISFILDIYSLFFASTYLHILKSNSFFFLFDSKLLVEVPSAPVLSTAVGQMCGYLVTGLRACELAPFLSGKCSGTEQISGVTRVPFRDHLGDWGRSTDADARKQKPEWRKVAVGVGGVVDVLKC